MNRVFDPPPAPLHPHGTMSEAACEIGHPPERLLRLLETADGHFWHEPRQRLLRRTIGARFAPGVGDLVDVGCGSGALVNCLCEDGYAARGVDPWTEISGLRAPRFLPGVATHLPLADGSLAALCAFDVLEHLDDARALAEFRRVLVDSGLLFVSVPALPFLWSRRDELAGHQRRYTRKLLASRLAEAGFALETIFGYQFLLLPLLAASRIGLAAGDTLAEDRPPRWLNRLLLALNRIEVGCGVLLRPPIGSSLIAIATKRGPMSASP